MPADLHVLAAVRREHAEEAWRVMQSQLEGSLDQMKASKGVTPLRQPLQ